ncbi:hypothetical protein AGLY_018130 [Aphis glycines]|uniref:Uncharacterized protein n=1 Tax=Aphis glycines TaxID=307491 RepID=A0A6G0STQ3_APHGL|nr:hypothetical protein AGLY_018130 [Aphis glycines]
MQSQSTTTSRTTVFDKTIFRYAISRTFTQTKKFFVSFKIIYTSDRSFMNESLQTNESDREMIRNDSNRLFIFVPFRSYLPPVKYTCTVIETEIRRNIVQLNSCHIICGLPMNLRYNYYYSKRLDNKRVANSTVTRIKKCKLNLYFKFISINDRTSGIPILYYQVGILDEFLTNEICSENEKHDYTHPMQQYILH